MGQIFSLENKEKTVEKIQDTDDNELELEDINEMYEIEQQEIQMAREHYGKKIHEISDKCKDFHKKMQKLRVCGRDGGETINNIQATYEEDEDEIPHPFVCKASPFYNNCTDEMYLNVEEYTEKDYPFAKTEDEDNIKLIFL